MPTIGLTCAIFGRTVRSVLTPNPTQQLAAIILGKPLGDYVAAKRGEGLAWRRVASALNADTTGRIVVSHEALRLWYGDDLAAKAGAA